MAADGHDEGDDAVDALGALVLGRLQIAGRILGDGDDGRSPAVSSLASRLAMIPR